MRAWHFVSAILRDGSPIPPDGAKLVHHGPVVPCESGLHASCHPFDALKYATGTTLCLVEVGGTVVFHGNPVDKLACSERTIINRMDATPLLRYFARQWALSVVHLWEPPQIVLDYLMGDGTVVEGASAAAWKFVLESKAPESESWAAMSAAWAADTGKVTESARWAAKSAGEALGTSWDEARDEFAALVHEAFADFIEEPATRQERIR